MTLTIRPHTYIAEASPRDGHAYHLTVLADDHVTVWSSRSSHYVLNEGSVSWPSLEAATAAANAHHENAQRFASSAAVAADDVTRVQ